MSKKLRINFSTIINKLRLFFKSRDSSQWEQITRNYYNKRKDEPEYMEHKRAKARASYKRRQEAKTKQEEENGKEEAPAINISLYSTDTDV